MILLLRWSARCVPFQMRIEHSLMCYGNVFYDDVYSFPLPHLRMLCA